MSDRRGREHGDPAEDLRRTNDQINRAASQWHALIAGRVLGNGSDARWMAEVVRLERLLDGLFARKRAVLNAHRVAFHEASDRRRHPGTRRTVPRIFTQPVAESEQRSRS